MVAIPYWLIEYTESFPCPVYVRMSPKNGTVFTCDPWSAMKFNTKEKAEEYVKSPAGAAYNHVPWAAVEHEFTY